jgi:hypothetical protein
MICNARDIEGSGLISEKAKKKDEMRGDFGSL